MQPLFEHRRTFAGYDTRVLELEGDGPPLLFLHGFADSADTWRRALAVLGRHDRRAVAVDLPGFAATGPLRAGPILPQLDAFAAAVAGYVRAESAAPPVVIGNSLGGCVALRLAERQGERLAGAVAVAPAGLDMAAWFGLIERDPLLRTLLAVPFPLPGRVVREAVGRVYRLLAFSDQSKVSGEVVDMFAAHHSDRATVARFMATGRALLPELRDPFDLEAIGCPVLLVWGARDRMVYPTGAERVIAAVPGARLELFDGCGHCPQIEQAERFCRLLLDFPDGGAAQAA